MRVLALALMYLWIGSAAYFWIATGDPAAAVPFLLWGVAWGVLDLLHGQLRREKNRCIWDRDRWGRR